jgi:hypothetical protein
MKDVYCVIYNYLQPSWWCGDATHFSWLASFHTCEQWCGNSFREIVFFMNKNMFVMEAFLKKNFVRELHLVDNLWLNDSRFLPIHSGRTYTYISYMEVITRLIYSSHRVHVKDLLTFSTASFYCTLLHHVAPFLSCQANVRATNSRFLPLFLSSPLLTTMAGDHMDH